MDEQDSNIPFNVVHEKTDHFEVELVESKTFSVLNRPEYAAVKGDENYEKVQRMNQVFLVNQANPYNDKTDNSTQTSSYLKYRNADCQTVKLLTDEADTNVHDFNLIDERNKNNQVGSSISDGGDGASTGPLTVFYLERALAQNAFGARRIADSCDGVVPPATVPTVLAYLFTFKLPARHAGLVVRCTHWNGTVPSRLLAVAYNEPSGLRTINGGDGPGTGNAVAVWSTKNPLAPERFYEFGQNAISSLKFSTEIPSRLAIGFDHAQLMVIDVSSKELDIIFQSSTVGVNSFWTTRNNHSLSRHYEVLNVCSSNGNITCCRELKDSFEEKTIMQLSQNNDELMRKIYEQEVNGCHHEPELIAVTRSIGLDQNLYLVGNQSGSTYACMYENSIRDKVTSRTQPHRNRIVSLEKSPFSQDVYLTAGYDNTVQIWVGDVFTGPVMKMLAVGFVVGATWSHTNPTIVVAITKDYRIYVWDVNQSTEKPISIYETQPPDGGRCSGIQFSGDGQHLSVSDTAGRVFVYVWSDVFPAASRLRDDDADVTLKDCVMKHLLSDQPSVIEAFCKIRPEYESSLYRVKMSEIVS